MRVEHEYDGAGRSPTWPLCTERREGGGANPVNGIGPFGRLAEQVMTAQPYRSAERVFWIVDNGSNHRGQRSVDRLEGEWPTLRLIQRPVRLLA